MKCSTLLRPVLAGFIAIAGLALAMPAAAQLHTIFLGADCSTAKPGDNPTCILQTGNLDGFNDDILVKEAWMIYDDGGDNVRDPAVGNLPISATAGPVVCAPGPALPCTIGFGGTVTFESDGYTVQGGDPDPLPIRGFTLRQDLCNGTPSASCNPADDTANVSVQADLFQPAIDISKSANVQAAKVGDTVGYTITLNNNSSADTPDISCSVIDSLLGDISGSFPDPLPLGPSVVNIDRDVQGGDPNPLVNSVSASCSIAGFPNVLNDADQASVDVFAPAIAVTKTADPLVAKVGDSIDYTITLSNNSSAGTPALNCVADDSLLGEVFNGVLPFGDTVLVVQRDVQGGDPDPLINTVDLDCSVAGFPNQLSDSDSASVDLLAPAVSLSKTCAPPQIVTGDDITWTISVSNDGDAALECLVNDATAGFVDEPVNLGPFSNTQLIASRATTGADEPVLSNTASVSCELAGGVLPNILTDEDTADCEVTPPGDAICRTPGFWGTHAGTEKRNSSDLTQIVINEAGGSLSVCGETITNTNVGNVMSAVEAICVSIQGEQRLQLARQLTALALNCVISGGTASCGGTEQSTLFADANAACIADAGDLSSWIEQVDAVNNGAWDGCHDRELSESDVFDGVSPLPGPAGSSNACNAATSNSVNIFQ